MSKTDLQKAKEQGKSIAEMKYPNSETIKKLTEETTKRPAGPKPDVCKQHQMIDYKTLSYLAKEQMTVIKQLTKAVADMEQRATDLKKVADNFEKENTALRNEIDEIYQDIDIPSDAELRNEKREEVNK